MPLFCGAGLSWRRACCARCLGAHYVALEWMELHLLCSWRKPRPRCGRCAGLTWRLSKTTPAIPSTSPARGLVQGKGSRTCLPPAADFGASATSGSIRTPRSRYVCTLAAGIVHLNASKPKGNTCAPTSALKGRRRVLRSQQPTASKNYDRRRRPAAGCVSKAPFSSTSDLLISLFQHIRSLSKHKLCARPILVNCMVCCGSSLTYLCL